MRRWWHDSTAYEETAAHYGPALRGEEPAEHYVIVVDGRDVGMIETYLWSDYPAFELEHGVAGVDLLIGEEELTGRGLGAEVLRAFLCEVARAGACAASVDEENRRSWRAFEKAGFVHVRDVEENGRPHRLMRFDRP